MAEPKEVKTPGKHERLYNSTVKTIYNIVNDVLTQKNLDAIDSNRWFDYAKRLDAAIIESVEGVGNPHAFSAWTSKFTVPFVHALGKYAAEMIKIETLPFTDTLEARIDLLKQLNDVVSDATQRAFRAHADGIADEIGWKPDDDTMKLAKYQGVMQYLKRDQKLGDSSKLLNKLKEFEEMYNR